MCVDSSGHELAMHHVKVVGRKREPAPTTLACCCLAAQSAARFSPPVEVVNLYLEVGRAVFGHHVRANVDAEHLEGVSPTPDARRGAAAAAAGNPRLLPRLSRRRSPGRACCRQR